MYTDLFLALLNRNNMRGHPILSAMLYNFCPTAARWWLAGTDPILPFDPVWRSIEDRASGGTLKDHLERYGFDRLFVEIKTYIEEIQRYRSRHPVQAPEIYPQFQGGRIPTDRLFGSYNTIEKLGGNVQNLLTYVRTWAFLINDWRIDMNIKPDSGFVLRSEKVYLSLPFAREPAEFDVWKWQVPNSPVMQTNFSLLVSNMEQDQLRFSLLKNCSLPDNQPWPTTPTIFAIDRETGEAKQFVQTLANRDLEHVMQSLSKLAGNGPYPPLNAISHSSKCKKCGFQTLCFDKKFISSQALDIK